MSNPQPLKIFCSYAHEDEDGLDTLRTNLSALRRNHLIEDWHDRQIPPGAFWDDEIRHQLDTADVILLLVSADFINSDYCMSLEVKRAYERAREGSATVIPIFYRHCHTANQPFADGQGTPTDMKWICDQPKAQQDASWTEVTKFIERAVINRRALADLPNTPETIQTFFPNTQGAEAEEVSRPDKPRIKGIYFAYALLLVVGVGASVFWFSPFDAATQSAKSLLLQGDYSGAKLECQTAPPSAFRSQCLEITSLALDDLKPQVRQARLKAINSDYSELLLAEMDINKKNYTSAEARYQSVAAKNPDIPQVQFGLGRVLHMLNKPEEALEHYQRALGTEKDVREQLEHSGISLSIAGALTDAGSLEEAEKAYRRVLDHDKSVILAHIQLVRVLDLQGKREEAQEEVIRAQNIFGDIGTKVLQAKQHNSQTWWYMSDEKEPVLLGGWKDKNVYMSSVFGSVF